MRAMRVAWVVLVAGCGFRTPGAGGGVEAPAAPDAAVDVEDIDAAIDAAFDFALCPGNYNLNLQLPGPVRYRLISEGDDAWVHSDDCNDDLAGATHLVVLETMAEVLAIGTLVDTTAGISHNSVWIGAVQVRNSAEPRNNWLGFDGAPLIDAWATNEPNDAGGGDNVEQFVRLERARNYFVDIFGSDDNGAVCECDGKPVAPNAAAAIADNRP